MARKRVANNMNPAAATASGGSSDGPSSPNSTGAMDSLLEKLRAAAPQARDQRDRRRRARLKDRHQIRVASGQKIPDMTELAKGETDEAEDSERALSSPKSSLAEVPERDVEADGISEAEDVAERAASMLQGLRGDGEGDTDVVGRDTSLRVRRRRESADDERRSRRRRRGAGTSSTSSGVGDKESSLPTPIEEQSPIVEESPAEGRSEETSNGTNRERQGQPPPATIISPPSPEGTADRPVEIPD